MTEMLPDPPELDPAALASSDFTRTRRGLESTEVRATLGRAADALRAWQDRDTHLRAQIEQLNERLAASREMDEQRIATVLGEETARIVTVAREAAAEIRSKAQAESDRLVADTEQQAAAAADALRAEAQTLRDDAAEAHSAAVADATRLRDDAAAAAAREREEAAALATSTVSDAQERSDQLLADAASVLLERTAEADVVVAQMNEDAQRVLEEASTSATLTRDEATVAASEMIEAARAQAQDMLAETRAVRERMLRDLAEKRRSARRQIEGAFAGRDRIIEVLREAGTEVGATIGRLDRADDDASAAADGAAVTVGGDLELEIDELRQELILDPEPVEPDSTEPDRTEADGIGQEDVDEAAVEQDAVPDLAVGTVSMEAVVVETVTIETDGVETDVVEAVAVETVMVESHGDEAIIDGPNNEVAGVGSTTDRAADDPADPVERPVADPDEQGEQGGGATVHDLFARIRAEKSDDDDDDDDDDEKSDDGVSASAGVAGTAAAVGGARNLRSADAPSAPIDLTVASADQPTAVLTEEPREQSTERLLDRRDEVLVPIEKSLSRVLKRLASDEQNEILDRLRRVKRGRPNPDEVLPEGSTAEFADALSGEFSRAVDTGAEFWATLSGAASDTLFSDDDMVRSALVERVDGFLGLHRVQLQRTFSEADEADMDAGELGDRIRATYRDWRSGSLADLAGDLAIAGFTLGERRAAGPGTPWRWVVDNGGLPCADGEDNALAGEIPCEAPFPTGDVTPPAHPGCRCILAPTHR